MRDQGFPSAQITPKMEISLFKNIVVLDSKVHTAHKMASSEGFLFAQNVLSAPLSMTEVVKASREFPIFFPTSGKFLPVAQMGYRKDANLYVDENGEWTARYMPAHIRRFPFILGEKKEAGEYVIMVDKEHISLKADGEALFKAGKVIKGGVVDRAREFLITFQRELDQTEKLLKPLQDAEILVSKVYTIRQGEEVLGNVRDLQIVDTDKLAALDDETLAGWVRSGLMGIIVAHLQSLDNWNGQKALSGSDQLKPE
jgi:hypothetical protein